jgi:hypothetical protein
MMNCERFESLLDSLLGERATPAERAEADAHLKACARCAELDSLLRTGTRRAGPVDLASEVLARTSGPACERARQIVVEARGHDRDPMDRRLVDLHLDTCSACTAFVSTVAALGRDLPHLAAVDPGPTFLAAVLAATSGAAAPPPAAAEPWWTRFVVRPRFALELAFVGSMAVWLGFSLPPAVRSAPVEALARLRPAIGEARNVRRVVALPQRGAVKLGEQVQFATARGRATLGDVAEDLQTRAQRTRPSREALSGRTADLGQAVGRGDFDGGLGALRGIAKELGTLVRSFASSSVENTQEPERDTNTTRPGPTPRGGLDQERRET